MSHIHVQHKVHVEHICYTSDMSFKHEYSMYCSIKYMQHIHGIHKILIKKSNISID